MPLSTDVNLPKDHAARFPDRCVVCGGGSPASTVRLVTGTIGWWTWLLWIFGKPFTVRAPACKFCAWRLHLQRFLGFLGTIVLLVVVFLLLWPLVSDYLPRTGRRWFMMIFGVVCLIPYCLVEAFFPKPFDITAFRDSVDYEFRDKVMAYEFAQLNEDAAWVKIE